MKALDDLDGAEHLGSDRRDVALAIALTPDRLSHRPLIHADHDGDPRHRDQRHQRQRPVHQPHDGDHAHDQQQLAGHGQRQRDEDVA